MRDDGRLQEIFARLAKPVFIIMLLVCAYYFVDPIKGFLYKVNNWDDVVAARGDTLLTQHMFVNDRLYVEDPAEYSDHEQLDSGEYFHNVRVGSDVTLEQTKFVFNNGDVFRQVNSPYSTGVKTSNVDTIKLILRYKYPIGETYYYDKETESWVAQGKFHGGTSIPGDTLCYITFGDKYYVLTDSIYAYEEIEDGIVEHKESSGQFYLNNDGSIWQIILSYHNIEGVENHHWLLESEEPLVDLESSELLGNARILTDGLYEKVEDGYTPRTGDTWARAVSTDIMEELISSGKRADSEIGFAQLYMASRQQKENGSFETVLQNTELYNNYGIKYGYVDIKKNAQMGLDMLSAKEAFGETAFDEPIKKLAAFLKTFAEENKNAAAAVLSVPGYWRDGTDCSSVPFDKEASAALAEFFAGYAAVFGE